MTRAQKIAAALGVLFTAIAGLVWLIVELDPPGTEVDSGPVVIDSSPRPPDAAPRPPDAAIPVTFPLTVNKSGTGTGLVSGGSINCGTTCAATVNSGTTITLTAAPATGSTFAGWSGSCTGTVATCQLTMSGTRTVGATFMLSSSPPPTTTIPAPTRRWAVSTTGNNSTCASVPAAQTPTLPCQTLNHVALVMLPGDEVTAEPGDYAGFEVWWRQNAGQSATARFVFTGKPGARITSRNPRTADNVNIENSPWVVVRGFEIVNAQRAGIRAVFSNGVVFLNNVIRNSDTWGVHTGWSNDVVVENNNISDSRREHCVYVANSSSRPVIRGNTLSNACRAGIHLNGDLSSGYTENNGGVIDHALVENNIITNVGRPLPTTPAGSTCGAAGVNMDGVEDSIIRNNRIREAHANGIVGYTINGGRAFARNRIENNNIIVADDGRWGIQIMPWDARWGVVAGNVVTGNTVWNNHPWRGALNFPTQAIQYGLVSNTNKVINRFTIDDLAGSASQVLTITQWRTQTDTINGSAGGQLDSSSTLLTSPPL